MTQWLRLCLTEFLAEGLRSLEFKCQLTGLLPGNSRDESIPNFIQVVGRIQLITAVSLSARLCFAALSPQAALFSQSMFCIPSHMTTSVFKLSVVH